MRTLLRDPICDDAFPINRYPTIDRYPSSEMIDGGCAYPSVERFPVGWGICSIGVHL